MSSNHLQLLIVEDDHDLASAVIDYLALEDIHCDHVANGVACLQMIEKTDYDVIDFGYQFAKNERLRCV